MNRVAKPVSRYFDLLRGTTRKRLREENLKAQDALMAVGRPPTSLEVERALGRRPRHLYDGWLGYKKIMKQRMETELPGRVAAAEKAMRDLSREEDLVHKARVGTLIAATGLATGGGALHSHLKAKKQDPEGGEKTAFAPQEKTSGLRDAVTRGAVRHREKTSGLLDAVASGAKRYGELMKGTKKKRLLSEQQKALDAATEWWNPPTAAEVEKYLGRKPRGMLESGDASYQLRKKQLEEAPAKSKAALKALQDLQEETAAVERARMGTLLAAVGLTAGVGTLAAGSLVRAEGKRSKGIGGSETGRLSGAIEKVAANPLRFLRGRAQVLTEAEGGLPSFPFA